MELRQLRYFLAVAEELHFGRAADALNIVQSSVSQQIKRLERELGVTLIERSTRNVTLTAAGARFVPEARAVLEAERNAVRSMATWRDDNTEKLRIGSSSGLGGRLELVLAELETRRPQLDVRLASAPTRTRLRKVGNGDLDAAFVHGNHDESGLRFFELWHDELVVALPAAHRLSRGADVDIGDLAGLPLRLTPRLRNPILVDLVTSACREHGFEPKLDARRNTEQEALAVIGAGKPSWTVFYAAKAKLYRVPSVRFLSAKDPLYLPTSIAVRDKELSRPVRALLDSCLAVAAN